MPCKKLIVVVVLLSVILGVDAKRSPRKTDKLYRKAGRWQRKLRDVWALLGVKPFSCSRARRATSACSSRRSRWTTPPTRRTA